jgi:thioredoxin-related protein
MQKLFLALTMLILSSSINAQQGVPPYKRFPTLPPLRLLETDSVSIFTKENLKKNRPVLVMLFNPECSHCQHETEQILSRIDDFKKIQIVMATMMPLEMLRTFNTKYGLEKFHNITTGRDIDNVLPTFYDISNLPTLAFYDKKGKLIDMLDGAVPVDELLEKFQQK